MKFFKLMVAILLMVVAPVGFGQELKCDKPIGEATLLEGKELSEAVAKDPAIKAALEKVPGILAATGCLSQAQWYKKSPIKVTVEFRQELGSLVLKGAGRERTINSIVALELRGNNILVNATGLSQATRFIFMAFVAEPSKDDLTMFEEALQAAAKDLARKVQASL